jgi:hypothetical protein
VSLLNCVCDSFETIFYIKYHPWCNKQKCIDVFSHTHTPHSFFLSLPSDKQFRPRVYVIRPSHTNMQPCYCLILRDCFPWEQNCSMETDRRKVRTNLIVVINNFAKASEKRAPNPFNVNNKIYYVQALTFLRLLVTGSTRKLNILTTVRSAHTVFICFVFVWEQTATCAIYSINRLVFITEMKSVYSAVRTGSLNEAVCACATYNINWLVFITDMKSVYSAVLIGSLN